MPDYDPRIVALYDEDNPDGPDHEFYRALADEVDARTVIDLGCGTGLLTVTFARAGRRVIGIDPSTSMYELARRRANAEHVDWILGDSAAIPVMEADLAVMTGNVAQHIPPDSWHRTLGDLHNALRSGGMLAFESRNPSAIAWQSWTTPRTTRDTGAGLLEEWSTATEVAHDTVELTAYNRFKDTNETVVERLELAFRDRATIECDLRLAGFTVADVFGGWRREPLTDASALMVFIAHA